MTSDSGNRGKYLEFACEYRAAGTAAQSTQIAITSFGSDAETVLDISPPETAGASDAKATVSDRPDTVFDLPVKPEPNLVSLADLPLAVNDLRDPTLNVSGVGADIEVEIWAKSGDRERVLLYQLGDSKEKFRAEVPTALGAGADGG